MYIRNRLRLFVQVGDEITYSSCGNTVQSQAEARVTIQEIKSLGVLQTETCN